MNNKGFNTRLLHTLLPEKDPYGTLQVPVYGSVAFEQASARDIESAFKGEIARHIYSRSSNPTVQYLEKRILEITGGKYAIALSSGMAAISNLVLALTSYGDNFLVNSSLFGNTFSFFENTLKPFGIVPRFADFSNPEQLLKLIDSNTRFIFFETITNPLIEIFNIEKIASIAKKHNIPLIADSTLTPPNVFNAGIAGVDVEVISGTKYFSGGASALGGFIVDHGKYNWNSYPKFKPDSEKIKDFNLNYKLRKEVYRNLGACISAQSAYMLCLGLETLTLRLSKSNENAHKLAWYLLQNNTVIKVNYPGLEGSPFHELALKQFNGFSGCVLSFELESKKACFNFIDRLKIIRKATNMCDNKSLIIHPRSTIYCEFPEETLNLINVPDTLIRLSVGIEEVEDLIADIEQAFS